MRERGSGAPGRSRERARRGSIAGGEELAGECRPGATGHGFPIRKLLEKEEDEGNSLPSLTRPGRSLRSTLHGRRPWSSSEFAENGPRDHESQQEEHREKAGKEAKLTTARKRGKIGSEQRASRGESRRCSGLGGCAQQAKTEARRGEMGRGKRRAALFCPLIRARGRGGERERTWERGFGLRFL